MFLFSGREYQKFMILSSPRSGTHMLRTSLDSHPNIVCLTEMFNPDYTVGTYSFTENASEEEILDRYIFAPQKKKVTAVGFCLHRSDANFGNYPRLWEKLGKMPELRIISLRRRNLLRRHLSFKLRPRRGLPNRPATPLSLDRDELVADFRHQLAKVTECDRQFHNHPLMAVSYEDLCMNYEAIIRDLLTFLDVPYRAVKPATEKLARQSLSQAIRNYPELKQQFAGTEWAEFFDE